MSQHAQKAGNQVLINKNKKLQSLFQAYFKQRLQSIMDNVLTPTETFERKQIFPLLGVYAFYRRLYPSEEERDTYKALWAIQKRLPCVVGHRNNLLFIYKFLIDVISHCAVNLPPFDYIFRMFFPFRFLIIRAAGLIRGI